MFWWKCSGVTQYHQQIMACLVWLVSENLAAPRQQRHPFTHSCYLKPCQDPKAKGQSYKTGHAHITYLTHIWHAVTNMRYTHACSTNQRKSLQTMCFFILRPRAVQTPEIFSKTRFFCRFGVLIYRPRHVQYKHQKIYFAIIVPASIRCLGFVRFAAFKLIFDEDMVWPEKHLATLSWLPDQLIYILHQQSDLLVN